MINYDKIESESPYVRQPLPYSDNRLDPLISANTKRFPYDKHLNAFVDKLNKLAENHRQGDIS